MTRSCRRWKGNRWHDAGGFLLTLGATDGGCGDPSKERKRTAGLLLAPLWSKGTRNRCPGNFTPPRYQQADCRVAIGIPPEPQTGEPGLLITTPRIQITRAAPVLIGATPRIQTSRAGPVLIGREPRIQTTRASRFAMSAAPDTDNPSEPVLIGPEPRIQTSRAGTRIVA